VCCASDAPGCFRAVSLEACWGSIDDGSLVGSACADRVGKELFAAIAPFAEGARVFVLGDGVGRSGAFCPNGGAS
jgi:hypothetical protein